MKNFEKAVNLFLPSVVVACVCLLVLHHTGSLGTIISILPIIFDIIKGVMFFIALVVIGIAGISFIVKNFAKTFLKR